MHILVATRRTFRSAMTVSACAAAGSRVSAQVASPHAASVASFPDTPVGKLGQALIEVINSGDSTARIAQQGDRLGDYGAVPLRDQKLIAFLASR